MRDCDELTRRLRACEIVMKEAGVASVRFACADAADAIDELQAAVPKWISVEERLPEPGQGVLVYDDCGYMSVADYTHDKHFPTVYEFHVNGEYEPGVTHWMPLPEPPKEDAE